MKVKSRVATLHFNKLQQLCAYTQKITSINTSVFDISTKNKIAMNVLALTKKKPFVYMSNRHRQNCKTSCSELKRSQTE